MRALKFVVDRYLHDLKYVVPVIPEIGLFGVVGFPLYYFIWGYMFPQPYENIVLRAIGVLMGGSLMMVKYWPGCLIRLLPVYLYVVSIFVFPFFFTFMLLANDNNTVWLLSSMSAVFMLVIVFDWVNAVIQFVIGGALAVVAHMVFFGEQVFPLVYVEHLPVFLFAIVGAGAFSHTKEMLNQEKRSMVFAVGATIAHELRSPLLAIKMHLKSARRGVSVMENALTSSGGVAAEDGDRNRRFPLSKVVVAIDSADKQVEDSFTIIDMMLMNVNHRSQQLSDEGVHSAELCIERAVNGFPYKSSVQRGMVRVGSGTDFMFEGSSIIVVHVLYNLIKNAIVYVNLADREEGGEVVLVSEVGESWNRIRVRDSGCGISSDRIGSVFDWFYSDGRTNANAGIGLPFSKMAMDSLGGRIECDSVLGEYTEFTLYFPRMSGGG